MPRTPATDATANDRGTRTRHHQTLLKIGALQTAILKSTNFSSIATDEHGIIQIFNVGAERMLGYAAAEVLHKLSPVELVDQDEIRLRAEALSLDLGTTVAPGFATLTCKAALGIEDIYEITYLCKDGHRLPTVLSVTALRDDGDDIIGYLLIGTDNTARKQVEADRKQVEIELQKAKATAEKANLAKSEFLSSMSHELRTPLSAILGFAQLMETSSPAPTTLQQRSLDQILKAGWYLLDLINEILDLALVESGKLSLSLEPIALSRVLRECQSMIEPQAQKRGIRVSFPPGDEAHYIHADLTRMKQVMINLLSNAIKYNRVGGNVVVHCAAGAAGRIRITVEDSGVGLSPNQLAQLFQPFNRLGQEMHTVEGTGIGLVMTKRLVELMGGDLGVDSVVGKGSVFWIELNLTTATQLLLPPLQAQPAPTRAVTTALRSLLYVEDNPANLMLVEDLMKRRPDIQLFSACDGVTGIALAHSQVPDVILLDINLPGINGLEVLALLTAHPRTAHIPVVALSANAMPRDIERGLAAGFFRYLTKPIRLDEFMSALDLALAHAENKPQDGVA